MAVDMAALNALTAQWQAARADLDDSENRSKINYNNLLDQMRRSQLRGAGKLSVGMADRGLTHSGIAAQSQMKLQDEYNRNQGLAAQQQELALSTVARKRLEADAQYNASKGLF